MKKSKQNIVSYSSNWGTVLEKNKTVTDKVASLESSKRKLVNHQKKGYLGR